MDSPELRDLLGDHGIVVANDSENELDMLEDWLHIMEDWQLAAIAKLTIAVCGARLAGGKNISIEAYKQGMKDALKLIDKSLKGALDVPDGS